MFGTTMNRRGALARLLGTAALLPLTGLPTSGRASGLPTPRLSDGKLTIAFDADMRSRLSTGETPLTIMEPADALALAGGAVLDAFALQSVTAEAVNGVHGTGQCTILRGTASGIERVMCVTFLARYPGLALIDVAYRNIGAQPVAVAGWRAATHDLLAHEGGAWSYAGASYPDRRDAIQPVAAGFQQRNFMGMNGSDYGGGTPMAVVWRRDAGLAVGHLETVPHLVALPVSTQPGGTRIGMEADTVHAACTRRHAGAAADLRHGAHRRPFPPARCVSPPDGRARHRRPGQGAGGELRADLVRLGLRARLHHRTGPTARWAKRGALGLQWAVLDDGWQTSEGDWEVDRTKFPGGDTDMKAFADRIKAVRHEAASVVLAARRQSRHRAAARPCGHAAARPRRCRAECELVERYTLCPAYQPVVDHFRAQIRRMIGDWGFEGVKLDGQHLNGVAPCYNPAHNHARPEESYEKLQDFWKALYDEAIAANPAGGGGDLPVRRRLRLPQYPGDEQHAGLRSGKLLAGPAERQKLQGADGTVRAVLRRPCRAQRRA